MKFTKGCAGVTVLVLLLQSCQTLRQSSKYGFNEGFYKSRLAHKKLKKVYVVPDTDSIKVYAAKKLKSGRIDTMQSLKIAFPANVKPAAFESYLFRQNTFDIDLQTLLFRYRPARYPYPHQISTSFNGVIYLGYRTDLYHMQYRKTPLQVYKRAERHYAYSIGAFTGLGSTAVEAPVDGTGTTTTIHYDGMINLTGLAAILAAERITFGIAVGFDHLMDKNRKAWLYEGKPWLGLSVGLNLN